MGSTKGITKQYLIDIHKWRSVMALIACAITLVSSCYAFASVIRNYVSQGWYLPGLFRYFTTLSNMLTALASSFIMPFAINGIRKKRFVLPKWLSMLHYSGTVCLTLIFVFAMTFIMSYSKDDAIGGNNFYLHLICPIAVLISYGLVESSNKFSWKETLICLIPLILYSLVYLVMVVVIGEENGGWPDLYKLATFVPVYISFPSMAVVAYLVAFAVRKLSDWVRGRREAQMLSSWSKEAEPVEINIEVYGLGRFYGSHGDKDNLTVPLDILETLSKYYKMDLSALYNVYTKGLLEGVKEREDK